MDGCAPSRGCWRPRSRSSRRRPTYPPHRSRGDSDCTLTYLGTAAVPVHDIAPLPHGGLSYAAVLPVDLSAYTRACDEPVIGRIRAVLSWNVPPSTVDPDAKAYWGNRARAPA
ncbi:MAG: hypothetical protein E6F99_10940 [Actinobacteria bacterium]|nr:MAG: hypothetical protein E6F99_10940 [Actinomycetota bacterium]